MTFELTIDPRIERIVVEALDGALARGGARRYAAIVLDPHDGSILAVAERGEANLSEIRGLLSQIYEPGSSIMYVGIAAAIDQGLVMPETLIDCHDGYYEEGIGVWLRDDEANGMLPVAQVLTRSSNIGAYLIAKRLGLERLTSSLRQFGFGSQSGIGLPLEAPGMMVSAVQQNQTSLSRLAMGYQLTCTSIQSACAMAVIANGGDAVSPQLFRSIKGGDQAVPLDIRKSVTQQKGIISKRTALAVADMLRMSVEEGTGKLAAIPGIKVAGKTGTAQRFNTETRKYEKGHYFVSFVGFAPVEEPKIVCLVLADDPAVRADEMYGGKLCAPIFREIVGRVLSGEPVRPQSENNQPSGETQKNVGPTIPIPIPLKARDLSENPATSDVLTAKPGSKPNTVISPFPPNTELDVTGISPGSLVLDPTTQKVFRVP